jgi:hypothetical protein
MDGRRSILKKTRKPNDYLSKQSPHYAERRAKNNRQCRETRAKRKDERAELNHRLAEATLEIERLKSEAAADRTTIDRFLDQIVELRIENDRLTRLFVELMLTF